MVVGGCYRAILSLQLMLNYFGPKFLRHGAEFVRSNLVGSVKLQCYTVIVPLKYRTALPERMTLSPDTKQLSTPPRLDAW